MDAQAIANYKAFQSGVFDAKQLQMLTEMTPEQCAEAMEASQSSADDFQDAVVLEARGPSKKDRSFQFRVHLVRDNKDVMTWLNIADTVIESPTVSDSFKDDKKPYTVTRRTKDILRAYGIDFTGGHKTIMPTLQAMLTTKVNIKTYVSEDASGLERTRYDLCRYPGSKRDEEDPEVMDDLADD